MEKTLYWTNPIDPSNAINRDVMISSCDLEEAQTALENGAVCVITEHGDLAFTCYQLRRLERVQMPGDTIVYPSGRVLKVIT